MIQKIEYPVMEDDIVLAKKIASRRGKKKYSKKYSSHSQAGTHKIGLLGEIAFWRVAGLKLDLKTQARGDGGVDFRIGNCPIQLKTRDTNRYTRPDMLIEDDQEKQSIYVLAELDSTDISTVTLVGWATRSHIGSASDNIYGKRFVVSRRDLLPMGELIDVIRSLKDRLADGEELDINRILVSHGNYLKNTLTDSHFYCVTCDKLHPNRRTKASYTYLDMLLAEKERRKEKAMKARGE